MAAVATEEVRDRGDFWRRHRVSARGRAAKAKDFPLFVPDSTFTDDTVLTVAVASAIRERVGFGTSIRRWGRRYPHAGYGGWFRNWLFREDAAPYNSFGNGSAMRVAAIGWAFEDLARSTVFRLPTTNALHSQTNGCAGVCSTVSQRDISRGSCPREDNAPPSRKRPPPGLRQQLRVQFVFIHVLRIDIDVSKYF